MAGDGNIVALPAQSGCSASWFAMRALQNGHVRVFPVAVS